MLAFLLPMLIDTTSGVHHGRARDLDVPLPRVEAEVVLDGHLDEAVWQRASRLTGFSRYAPTDGEAADDSTEVLVWYSPTAIHFGIRAWAQPGSVIATLADRDRIYSDDYIGIFLGTFNDGRQALVFAANPLGIQGDGIVVENGGGGGGFGGNQVGREATDISPDFVFQSKGRLTEYGYEIEIRIPFKTLRYQSADPQTWGINVLRKVQSRGYEYSWAPARRAATSYLGQSGRLTGLTGMRRGLVLDLNPVVTGRVIGLPSAAGYDYRRQNPQFGVNARWGITTTLTLNGTVNPDFAEVESDAGQFSFDPRQSLFFPEKRPFFLDGSELFNTPGNLIYTRRILAPDGAVKLAGRVGAMSIAYLGAVDDTIASAFGEHPRFNILRLTRSVGPSSRVGLVYTDRVDGDGSNRVVGADTRLVFGSIYSAQLQGAMGTTVRPGNSTLTGPMWRASLLRTGRTLGASWSINGLHPDFRTASGFIGRRNIVHLNLDHSLTAYGGAESLIRSISGDVVLDGTWVYQDFVDGNSALEKKLHFNTNATLRGGWRAGASVLIEDFGYDPSLYADYAVERHQGAVIDTIPFTGTPHLKNLDYVLSLTTPQFRHFGFSGLFVWGRDENFFEWAGANIGFLSASGDWRPTSQLRFNASYNWQWYNRLDGSTVGEGRIPRIKVEYQLSRAIFLRLVGQYTSNTQDSLRDDGRTNEPLLIRDGTGTWVRATAVSDNNLQVNWLFSFLPSPGTVIYLGYGSNMEELESFRFRRLTRTQDGFFLKLSYLFRV
jgi:hypothetical protein